jgi:hypothetical protein
MSCGYLPLGTALSKPSRRFRHRLLPWLLHAETGEAELDVGYERRPNGKS